MMQTLMKSWRWLSFAWIVLLAPLGACVQSDGDGSDGCVRNSDCDQGATCVEGECRVECVEDRDCSGGLSCQEGSCVELVRTCRQDDDCVFGEVCSNGECVKRDDYCERTRDCPEGQVCMADEARCVGIDEPDPDPECLRNSDCPEGESCEAERCVEDEPEPECRLDSDCPEGERCAAEMCIPECAEDRDCSDGELCDRGRCIEDPDANNNTGQTCTQNPALCDASQECCEGTCVARGQCGPPPTCIEQPSLCNANQECCEGTCVVRGQCGGNQTNYWDICTARAQCDTELCLGDAMTGNGHCTEMCTTRTDCPQLPNSLCIQNYHNITQNSPEASNLCFADDTGSACTGPESCFDQLCMVRVNEFSQPDQRCTVRCQFSSDCLPGYGCGPITFGAGGQQAVINVCTPLGSTCSGIGEAAANQCFTGVCLTDDQTNSGYCTSFCSDNGQCPLGWNCTNVGGQAQVCVRQ